MRSHINVSSKNVLHISIKLSNDPNSFTQNETYIMQDISVTGAPSPQHITSSMEPPHNSAPGINLIHPEAVPMQKQ